MEGGGGEAWGGAWGFQAACRHPARSSLNPVFTEILFHEHDYSGGHGQRIHVATPGPLPSQEVGRQGDCKMQPGLWL